MAQLDDTALRAHLDNLLQMEGAHLSFDQAVAGFPAAQRGTKPPGAPHSAWELLEHMRLAQEDILDFSRNPGYVDKTFPDDYWPASPEPPSEEGWQQSVEHFQQDLAAFRALIADPANDLFTPLPHGTGQTLLREALVVADHNSYHLGQFMYLKKQLQA
ncbi:MAG: DinB family protein [Paludibaculum sp.]